MVHVTVNYEDASVIVVHGGVEIGQGINTKVCDMGVIFVASAFFWLINAW